eukprot:3482901-Pyramimonas_sp.AAC.1
MSSPPTLPHCPFSLATPSCGKTTSFKDRPHPPSFPAHHRYFYPTPPRPAVHAAAAPGTR